MPAWDRLPEEDLRAVAARVKSFSPRFAAERAAPVAVAAPPPATPQRIQDGRKVYELMKCAECHGPQGRGDGPASATLRDSKGLPIRAYDFTRGAGAMKGGASPQDIYRTFTTGLDGTPMPGFAESLSEEQRWSLVHYIRSLTGLGAAPLSEGTPSLRAGALKEDPPVDPAGAAWERVPATVVPLRPLWASGRSVPDVEVRAAAGPTTLSLRLE
jgi:mono/diheme cytochrome c family protein